MSNSFEAAKDKRQQERSKVMNRFAMVAYEINTTQYKNNSPPSNSGWGGFFGGNIAKKKYITPTCIEYDDLNSVTHCPICG